MSYKRREDIDYIKGILKAGSFQAASESLFVSQPAISQYIGRIEGQHGIKIFDRSKKPIALTEEGKYFLKVEEQIESLRRNREKYFADLKGLEAGKLTIGTNQCRTTTLLADVLSQFVKAHPKVKLELVEAPIRATADLILSGKVDFALTLESYLTDQMMYQTLADENLLIALPPGHPLEKVLPEATEECPYPEADFKLMKDEHFILLNRGVKFHDSFEVLCQKFKTYPEVILETESIGTVLDLVSKGVGCGLIPDSLIYYSQISPKPKCFSFKTESNRAVAAWNKEAYLSKAAETFIEMLVQKHKNLNSGYMDAPAPWHN